MQKLNCSVNGTFIFQEIQEKLLIRHWTLTTLGKKFHTYKLTMKLTILFSRLEGGSTTSEPAWIEGNTQIPISSVFGSKRNWKSSSLKCIEHSDDVFPGAQFFLLARTKSIHFFLLLWAVAFSEFRKGILCMLTPFAGSAMLSHRAATHLLGIFSFFSQRFDELLVRSLWSLFGSAVTCSLTYVTTPLWPRED